MKSRGPDLGDQKAAHRVALGVHRQHVRRVFLEQEQLVHRDPASGREELAEFFLVLGFFFSVFDRGANPLVGPTRQRSAKVCCQDRVVDLVRQDAVEDPPRRPDHFHVKVADRLLLVPRDAPGRAGCPRRRGPGRAAATGRAFGRSSRPPARRDTARRPPRLAGPTPRRGR